MDQRGVFATGGSRGIGAAVTLLASQKGYAVAINYRDDDRAAAGIKERIEAAGAPLPAS